MVVAVTTAVASIPTNAIQLLCFLNRLDTRIGRPRLHGRCFYGRDSHRRLASGLGGRNHHQGRVASHAYHWKQHRLSRRTVRHLHVHRFRERVGIYS